MEAFEMQNTLYPIFLKLNKLKMLIVGAGEVGHEKVSFILKSSPNAQLTIVAPLVSPEVRNVLAKYPSHQSTIIERKFVPNDIEGHDLVVAATNLKEVNHRVYQEAKRRRVLINVADTPQLCDFYLGSIVTRGHLKVAISTNGKSPTLAKRFRQVLEAVIPLETDDLLQNLWKIRNQLQLSFTEKVKKLNDLTASISHKEDQQVH